MFVQVRVSKQVRSMSPRFYRSKPTKILGRVFSFQKRFAVLVVKHTKLVLRGVFFVLFVYVCGYGRLVPSGQYDVFRNSFIHRGFRNGQPYQYQKYNYKNNKHDYNLLKKIKEYLK